jgi:hypothetical protein
VAEKLYEWDEPHDNCGLEEMKDTGNFVKVSSSLFVADILLQLDGIRFQRDD